METHSTDFIPENVTQPSPTPWYFNESWNWFQWYIFVWLFPTVTCMGAVGNLLCLVVMAIHRNTFVASSWKYMVAIAVSDVITLTLLAPLHFLTVLTYYTKENKFSIAFHPLFVNLPFCVLYFLIFGYGIGSVLFMQLGFSIERIIAVSFPLKASLILTRWKGWLLFFVFITMSLLVPIWSASLLYWRNNGRHSHCSLHQGAALNTAFKLDFFYASVAPILAIVVLTTVVIFQLRKASILSKRLSNSLNGAKQGKFDIIFRTSLILVCQNITLMLFRLPYTAHRFLITLELLEDDAVIHGILVNVFHSMLYFNNSCNFMFYFLGEKFRLAFRDTYSVHCCRLSGSCNGKLSTVHPTQTDSA